MVASLQKNHFHDLEILSRSRYSNRAVESLIMNNDIKPPALTEKRKHQDGKLQSYLEWPNILTGGAPASWAHNTLPCVLIPTTCAL